ncbi:MAG: hypothetical protein E7429_01280 [Ruminococcaceae bacterium]|nr:hypothetical protein [Oscillospiraceae bacterium]
MRYPKLCNWVLFEENPDGSFDAKDRITEDEYTLGSTIGALARKLDGKTDPFSILPGYDRSEVQAMLDALDEANLLRYGRLLDSSASSVTYSLIIPRKHRTRSILPVLINYWLLVLWIPVFLFGLHCFIADLPDLESGSFALGQWGGMMIGAILHEVSHAASALCYQGRVFEAGVLLHNYMPGAYVMLDEEPIKSRLQRFQVFIAGIEMNILLTGIALLLCVYVPSQSEFFFGLALSNLILALMNLTFSEGLDGMSAMGNLLGIDALAAKAKYTLKTKEVRRRLWKAGPHGVVELLICCLFVVLQAMSVSIYIVCFLGVAECFI